MAIFGLGSKLDSGSSFIMMTSFLGGVLCKLISFHSVDINGRKNVSYYVKELLYCTNICKEIYVIVLHIDMQGDIFYCIAYRYAKRYKHMQEMYFIVLHIGMQRDINICKEIYVIVLHIGMQRDINICKEICFIVLHIVMQIDINLLKEM